jgi:4'-phosphopantetheinyl transferase
VTLTQSWPIVGVPQKITVKQVHVWAWQLDSSLSTTDFESTHIELLDEEERGRFQRFHFECDRIRFAISHANRRRILGAYLERAPDRLLFRTNLFGKPELAKDARTRHLYFNLSHSQNVALLALSMDTEVGVDIEDIKPIEPEIAENYFSRAELSELASLKGQTWLHAFYLCWTRKEAILKAEGVGLNLPLDSFDVSLIPGSPAELRGARPEATFSQQWTLHNLSPALGTAAALAVGSPQTEVFCFRLGE